MLRNTPGAAGDPGPPEGLTHKGQQTRGTDRQYSQWRCCEGPQRFPSLEAACEIPSALRIEGPSDGPTTSCSSCTVQLGLQQDSRSCSSLVQLDSESSWRVHVFCIRNIGSISRQQTLTVEARNFDCPHPKAWRRRTTSITHSRPIFQLFAVYCSRTNLTAKRTALTLQERA